MNTQNQDLTASPKPTSTLGSPPIFEPIPVTIKEALLHEIDKALLLITEMEEIIGRAG